MGKRTAGTDRITVKTDMNDYEIVPMNTRHIAEVAALETVCFADPWSADSFDQSLVNDAMSFFVAVSKGGSILGYAGIASVADESELLNIAVDPNARRCGVASALLDRAIGEAKANGAAVMYLEVRESNDGARRLYEKYGFTAIGTRKNYYRLPCEDAVIMAATL